MKKAVIFFLVTLITFFPPLSIYFAIKSAGQLGFLENQANLEARITADMQQLGRSSDESNYLTREHARISGILRREKTHLLKNLADPELEKFITAESTETIARAGFPCEFEYLIFTRNNKGLNYIRSVHLGENLGLRAITADLKTDSRVARQPWQAYYRSALMEIITGRISRFAIRRPGQCMTISGERIADGFFVLTLADISDFSAKRNLQVRIQRFPERSYGIGAFFRQTSSALFTDYFKGRSDLQKLIKKYAARIGPADIKIQAAGYDLYFSEYDQVNRCRFFAVAPVQARQSQNMRFNHLWLAFIAIISCSFFRVLTEKLLLGRGPDPSFKVLIPTVFIFLVIQPLFASSYLAGEFLKASYNNEKNRVAGKLGNDLVSLNLSTSDDAIAALNIARGLNSIERIASFTGLQPDEDDFSLAINLLTQIRFKFNTNIFSSLWLCRNNGKFTAVKAHQKGGFMEDRTDNMVAELFRKRFLEIMRVRAGRSDSTTGPQNKRLNNDLKDEYMRDFFLKILGADSFYRFRQNSGFRIDISSNYQREQAITGPISFQKRLHSYVAWHVKRDSANYKQLRGSLTLDPSAARIALNGDESSITSVNFGLSEIAGKNPELLNVAVSSHVTRSRASSIIETPETTQINLAIPALYSDYTIAGTELMKSFAVFRDYMERRIGLLVAAILALGSLLAFAGALYFVWPLQELTSATAAVARGNFEVRIHEDHPDEFATLGRSFNNMANSLEEGTLLKNFVTDSVRREVAGANNSNLAERAETVTSTILFAAVCGFSEYQRSHDAPEVFNLLQHLLQAADEATLQFNGEIDKMIEDKVMIVFEHRGDGGVACPERAIRTAAFIADRVPKTTGMTVAAGINTGTTIAGIMGAEKARLSRTVVGDPVNLAARLACEAIKMQGGIVVSGQMLAALPEEFSAEKLPISTVKGKTQTIEAYRIFRS